MNFFQKLFEFIKAKIYDVRNPQPYRPYGISCYVGLPGSGKTLSVVEQLLIAKEQHPNVKIYTNFGFIYEDGQLTKWQDIIDIENGTDGVIFALDEVHSFFGRNDWKDMPPGVLQVFSQNRKMAKQFICTAQSYADIVVDLRRRCHEIVECTTLLGRWVFQRAFRPEDYLKDHDGIKSHRRRAWRYSFIATNEIYDAYDTYRVIESLRQSDTKALEKPSFTARPMTSGIAAKSV